MSDIGRYLEYNTVMRNFLDLHRCTKFVLQ